MGFPWPPNPIVQHRQTAVCNPRHGSLVPGWSHRSDGVPPLANEMFRPGDVIAFAGNSPVSRLIELGTCPGLLLGLSAAVLSALYYRLDPFQSAGLLALVTLASVAVAVLLGWLAVSHVGICTILKKEIYPAGGVLLVESTTLCDEPCLITGTRIDGVQAHRPETRIAGYPGRVYILRPSKKFPFSERAVWTLAYYSAKWIGTPYDMRGAIHSVTPLPDDASDDQVFCDDLVATLLMNCNRLARGNPKSYTPASLVRALVRTGVYRRWQRIFIFPTLVWAGAALPLGAAATADDDRLGAAAEENGRRPTEAVSAVGTARGNQDEPDWINVPPVRAFHDSRAGDLLSDIESHLPAGHIYRSADLVNWAHETTHGINSRIRTAPGRPGHCNAFYVLANRAALFVEPRIRKSQVGRYVPAEFRDDTFALYVMGQPDWDGEPLYLLDEWVAYTNGTEVALEQATRGRQLSNECESTENMLEFCSFGAALLCAVRAGDPGYAAFSALERFVRWNVRRSIDLAQRARPHAWLFDGRCAMLLVALKRRIGATR